MADTLQAGDSGPEVEQLQQHLQNLGYQLEVNSQYDETTTEAVRLYQQQNSLLDTGIADLDTQNYVETHANQNVGQAADQGNYEEPAGAAEVRVGELSPDGAHQWDGQQWQPVNDPQQAADAAADGGVGQLSEDGQYRWNGQDWLPVDGEGAGAPAAASPGAGAAGADGQDRSQVTPDEWASLVASSISIDADGEETA
ncbi:MAG: putative peptidoglycan binding domain [Pseudonocardiales bacterium]|nr:putative peptidoglycan binding domain [Pseudonocardiales bacterium]